MGAVDNAAGIGILRYWCQKILPAVYDDSLSYYELLCKVVDKLNEVVEQTNSNSDAIVELNRMFTEYIEHGYDDFYEQQINDWVAANLERIMLHQFGFAVWFGLTDDGYFAAYYPESWSDIRFDTGKDYDAPDYGCLELYY